MRILVTAIGSMSAECVIKRLKNDNYYVVGCDIYPSQWHYETRLCDDFVQAPLATPEKAYIDFLLSTCKEYNLNYIIPLTDIEIDVINRNRESFINLEITICTQSDNVLKVVRNKYSLFKFFEKDNYVPSIQTYLLKDIPPTFKFPCIAKPCYGRSSEGLLKDVIKDQLQNISNKEQYLVQEQISGNVFTVDYIRCAQTGIDVAIPRVELLRTKNGAGTTIKTISDRGLMKLSSHIGEKLNINGCVNMEFIQHSNTYYLIDINPRFSAGIAFSLIVGYDMISNHLNCFCGKDIDRQVDIAEKIIIKKYEEVIS